ncbi:MAG: hypothetical protein JNL11_02510 [Bdellovibrionaceae bacterium]|nr:hypothetical protein [Pseudobdellovibrionaceae bacterium]
MIGKYITLTLLLGSFVWADTDFASLAKKALEQNGYSAQEIPTSAISNQLQMTALDLLIQRGPNFHKPYQVAYAVESFVTKITLPSQLEAFKVFNQIDNIDIWVNGRQSLVMTNDFQIDILKLTRSKNSWMSVQALLEPISKINNKDQRDAIRIFYEQNAGHLSTEALNAILLTTQKMGAGSGSCVGFYGMSAL